MTIRICRVDFICSVGPCYWSGRHYITTCQTSLRVDQPPGSLQRNSSRQMTSKWASMNERFSSQLETDRPEGRKGKEYRLSRYFSRVWRTNCFTARDNRPKLARLVAGAALNSLH